MITPSFDASIRLPMSFLLVEWVEFWYGIAWVLVSGMLLQMKISSVSKVTSAALRILMPCCVSFSILPAVMKSITAKMMFAPLTAFFRSSMSAWTSSAPASAHSFALSLVLLRITAFNLYSLPVLRTSYAIEPPFQGMSIWVQLLFFVLCLGSMRAYLSACGAKDNSSLRHRF